MYLLTCYHPSNPPPQPPVPAYAPDPEAVRARFFSMVKHTLAYLDDCCGVCFVVTRDRVPRSQHANGVNDCPAAQQLREAFNILMASRNRPPFMASVCFKDVGPHEGRECPIKAAEADKTLAKADTVCSNCWLGEDGEVRFHGAGEWGANKCAAAHPGRAFVTEAVFALYHGRPDFVSRALAGVTRWELLPRTSSHYCAAVAGPIDQTPSEMPPLLAFAQWARSRWLSRLKVSCGMVLLIHFHHLSKLGTLDILDSDDHNFWQNLLDVTKLERPAY